MYVTATDVEPVASVKLLDEMWISNRF